MSLVDKVKDWFLVNNNNQDTLNDGEDENTNETEDDNNTNDDNTTNSRSTSYDNEPRNNRPHSSSYDTREPSVNNGAKTTVTVNAKLEVVLVRPEVFTDAKQIADHLIKRKTVVLNLENAKPENKRRIIDFLAGVAYANGGSIKAVANRTYIITPSGVGFIGDELVGELENSGVIM